MGKAGRIACIFTPMALTLASFICLILIEVSGWGGNHGQLNSYYFMKADFSDLHVPSGNSLENATNLPGALAQAQSDHTLANIYEIHLWNYCSSNSSSSSSSNNDSSVSIDYCSSRHSEYYFDPIAVWHLNSTNTTSTADGDDDGNALSHAENTIKNNTEALESKVLGKSGKEALDAYRAVAKWMFVAYEISFWTTLGTLVVGVLAIFSRWGSFLTWILAFASSAFTFAAVLTSTILFSALAAALASLFKPYDVHIHLGHTALAVTWLAVLFSWAGTLFWLFSVCCCSGRSNPHHRSNKGGLWQAEPKGQGYGDFHGAAPPFAANDRGRGLRVEKTGGGYERVSSPFLGGGPGPDHHHGDRVPLADYPQQTGYAGAPPVHAGDAYEPFRHG